MRILVIDDNEINLKAAAAQLADHELTLVNNYQKAQDLINGDRWGGTKKESFDAVLVDLLMPASGLGSVSYDNPLVGQEMPVGIFLALLAAKNNAKYVAVFTDSCHHSHPASACFDAFNGDEYNPKLMKVENAYLMMSNTRNWICNFLAEDLTKEATYKMQTEMTTIERAEKLVRAKNWFKLLDHLMYSIEQLDKSSNNL